MARLHRVDPVGVPQHTYLLTRTSMLTVPRYSFALLIFAAR